MKKGVGAVVVFQSGQFSGLICESVSFRFVFKERSGVQLLVRLSLPPFQDIFPETSTTRDVVGASYRSIIASILLLARAKLGRYFIVHEGQYRKCIFGQRLAVYYLLASKSGVTCANSGILLSFNLTRVTRTCLERSTNGSR
ncbi:hypothetical protein TcasGA2_TC007459 [Tribolium castaneum]|uniref:Uncharacterized protein n=1 Tax=Tribolium castaneum TaxID=7070 RepID=D1ZZG4_TRICA|nr:hypothetical protein TcasGA2_TC007459 [Tribolium castaneum]